MTSSQLRAVGRREERDGRPTLVIERTFRAPVADVWAAITEPERLVRWIGTWSGDPASGAVMFRMTAEGDDVAAEAVTIHECSPPERLELTIANSAEESGHWHLELDLSETAGATTLTFAQRLDDPALAKDVGPGWEYYLDRLVAAQTGGHAAEVAWTDYEVMSRYYEPLFTEPS
jgi:uncharacterized protein YndB with AHSA1/START domain